VSLELNGKVTETLQMGNVEKTVWKSGFDYTDIVKCDGGFFLISTTQHFVRVYKV